jgi:diguanylate cyclase (GGDEF)-like protein/PAS domain S-box-containing protein
VGAVRIESHRRRSLLAAAVVLYAVVFALAGTVEVQGGGFVALYVLPIAIVAVEYGRRAGALAAALALGLFVLGASVSGQEIGIVSFLLRGVVFLSIGLLTGRLAQRMRVALKASQASANHFELSRDMLGTASLDGCFTQLNEAWEKNLGWTREELMAKPFLEFVHPDDRERTVEETSALSRGAGSVSFSNRYATKDGRWRWIEWSSRVDLSEAVIYAVARDVTERREMEQRVNLGIELSPVGIAVVGVAGDEANQMLRVNAKLAELVGRPAEELVGSNSLADIAHPDDVPALADSMARLLSGDVKTVKCECRIVRPDGEEVWVELTTGLVRDTSGTPMYRLSHVLDIGDRKHAEEKLRYLADHDALAGTVNRRRFEYDLALELEQGDGGALLVLDLDGFKRVNDSLGHAAGDAVIAQVGRALTGRLRKDTDIVGRLGGDEFAVVLRRLGADHARSVAEDVRKAILTTLEGDSAHEVRAVTVSVGLAAFLPGADIDADDLLHVADLAMYEAKEAGGNRVVSAVAREMTHPRQSH